MSSQETRAPRLRGLGVLLLLPSIPLLRKIALSCLYSHSDSLGCSSSASSWRRREKGFGSGPNVTGGLRSRKRRNATLVSYGSCPIWADRRPRRPTDPADLADRQNSVPKRKQFRHTQVSSPTADHPREVGPRPKWGILTNLVPPSHRRAKPPLGTGNGRARGPTCGSPVITDLTVSQVTKLSVNASAVTGGS